jgi:hypothetical protein
MPPIPEQPDNVNQGVVVNDNPGQATVWTIRETTGADERRDIYFGIPNGESPAQHHTLKEDIERTLSGLNTLYPDEKSKLKFDSAFSKLLSLAKLGLAGENPNNYAATQALKSLQEELIDKEAARVKNSYLKRVGVWSFLLSFLPGLLITLKSMWPTMFEMNTLVYHLMILWCGCMVGTWLSVSSRKLQMTFNQMIRIEDDHLDPSIRLLFTGLIAIVIALSISTGAIQLSIGEFQPKNWIAAPQVAFLLGALTGIAEKALPAKISNEANKLFAARP